jgi:hypothetical protein
MKNFDSLEKDTSERTIHVGTHVRMNDATGTPVESPVALTDSITTINVPDTAAEMFVSGAVAFRFGVDDDLSDGYTRVPADVGLVIPVAKTDTLYFRDDGDNGNLSFFFIEIAQK